MTEQRKNNGISSGVAAAVAAATIAVAGVAGYFAMNPGDNPAPNPGGSQSTPNPGGLGTPETTSQNKATVYWLKPSGTSFNLVPQPIQVQADVNNPSEFLEAAFNSLLAGPTEGSGSTAIPKETKLLGITAEGDEVRVNLSDDFQYGGGSTAMIGRVGQVVYTATALNPNAKVYLELNGEQIEVLGGAGLELEQPLTRENFLKNFEL